MAYIITEPCIGTKDTACVDVCPVDCIHPRKDEPAFETAECSHHPDVHRLRRLRAGRRVDAIDSLDETPSMGDSLI